MTPKKVVFIVPGYRHSPTSKAYLAIAQQFRTAGYEPIVVAIPWKKATISENTEYFLKTYNKIKTKKKYILGFSFGAMIALIASTKVEVDGLMLCSLSPYFREDVAKETLPLSPIQADRRQDFLNLHAETLAKQIRAEKVLFLYGSKEARALIKRVKETFAQVAAAQKY